MPDLQPNIAQRQKEESERLVPSVGSTPVGYALRVTGHSPPAFAWRQDNDENEILRGNGDPNGVQFAQKGRLYVERDVPALWQNTDGLSAWQLVGSGGDSFWFSDPDENNRLSIVPDPAIQEWIVNFPDLPDAGNTYIDVIADTGDGYIDIEASAAGGKVDVYAYNDVNIGSSNDGDLKLHAAAGNLEATDIGGDLVVVVDIDYSIASQNGGVYASPSGGGVYCDAGCDVTSSAGPVQIVGGGGIFLPGLPTSDPGNPGQLYVSAGVLMVSP